MNNRKYWNKLFGKSGKQVATVLRSQGERVQAWKIAKKSNGGNGIMAYDVQAVSLMTSRVRLMMNLTIRFFIYDEVRNKYVNMSKTP